MHFLREAYRISVRRGCGLLMQNRSFRRIGVLDAAKTVETDIGDVVRGIDVREQLRLNNMMRELDGTENKSRVGANAILGVSLAVARLDSQVTPQLLSLYLGGLNASLLPVPCMNIINCGVHARG